MVGTKGLGQQVYVADTSGDAGKAMIAGFSITGIATIADLFGVLIARAINARWSSAVFRGPV